VWGLIMDSDALMFFDKMPQALPLYEAVAENICGRYAGVKISVKKTQISFSNKYNFAFVSLPVRKVKNRPAVYIILTFGLCRQISHPRIAVSTEPYPNRWTHHVIIQSADEIDAQVMAWIDEAYYFSLNK